MYQEFKSGLASESMRGAVRRALDPLTEDERAFWRRTLEDGNATDADLDHAIELMIKHRAIEDTIQRARHYGAIAKDALALFPASPMKEALEETVEFCIARSN